VDDRNSENTELIESEPVNRIFRPQKRFLTDGITSLIFFSLLFFGFGYAMWLNAPADRRDYSILLAAGCWLLMAPIFIWSILVWYYVSVTLQNGNVSLKGVFFCREINLSDIEVIHWRLYSHGQIKVQTAVKSGTINFYYYTEAEQLWLIQYFREQFPEDQQQNWPLFCLKVALPLLKPKQDKPREPGPDDVLHTRRDWDRLTTIMTSITALIGIYTAWVLQKPGYLFLPLLPLCMWFMRYAVPQEGEYVTPTSADKDFMETVTFFARWSLAWFVIYLPFSFALIPSPPDISVGWTINTIWITGLYWKLFQMNRKQHLKDLEKAEEAVKEWETEVALRFPSTD